MEENKDEKKIDWKIPAVIFAVVIILWLLNFYFLYEDKNNRGTFGDMFGGINALFSGLAFAGVIYTILLQQKELSLQREELKMTRKELAVSRPKRTNGVAEQNPYKAKF